MDTAGNAVEYDDVNDRFAMMMDWLGKIMPVPLTHIEPASEDASFRRYFRIYANGASRIVMDAPPAQEDSRPFVALASALEALGLHVPVVLEADLDLGFLLLTDLGKCLYSSALNGANAERLYGDALITLERLQTRGDPASPALPRYDAELLRLELELFRDWFLGRHLGLTLEPAEHQLLNQVFELLCANALAQPQVWVHRDYHCRNLMVTAERNPGVLDFQGAVIGPITYDLVSLLRDCYVAWPDDRVKAWALAHRDRLRACGMPGLEDQALFLRWFDLMGLQRHLKAIGIFARLHLRDGKAAYLGDIPRTMVYVLNVSHRYPELAELYNFLMTLLSKHPSIKHPFRDGTLMGKVSQAPRVR